MLWVYGHCCGACPQQSSIPKHWEVINISTPQQVVFQFTALRPVGSSSDWPEASKKKLFYMDSWREFSRHMELTYIEEFWSSLSRTGPPQVPPPGDALTIYDDILALEWHRSKPRKVAPTPGPTVVQLSDGQKIDDLERTINDLSRQVNELKDVIYPSASSGMPWLTWHSAGYRGSNWHWRK